MNKLWEKERREIEFFTHEAFHKFKNENKMA